MSPASQRHLVKLDHGIHQTLTTNQILQNQVRQDRKVRIDVEIVKRTKRIKKREDKRVWSLQEILDARNPEKRRQVKIKRKRKPKGLVVTIPVPIRD